MLSFKKILLPVDFPLASPAVFHQAGILARHFDSELVLLHVMTQLSHAAGVPVDPRELATWDLLAAIIQEGKKQQYNSLASDVAGLKVRARLANGDVAKAIVQATQEEKADLVMMPSHSFTFYQFLLGSVTAKVLQGTECPVWTGAHVEDPAGKEFAVRSVLCAVEFGPRAGITVSWASQVASEFGAHLTLVNVTAGVEMWGPGGSYVDQRWKDELTSDASRQMAKLQQDEGVKADVIIGNGDLAPVLGDAVKQTKADLLVNGCYPYGGNLRTKGFGVICAVPIPVLNV
jgi:nucleotide-binding universal stress UspA family protein